MPVSKRDVVPAPLVLENCTDQRRARAFGTARTQLPADPGNVHASHGSPSFAVTGGPVLASSIETHDS